jgi:hypothetical protein
VAQSSAKQSQSRWYPSEHQLKDPSALARAFKQLLDQHYVLQDAHSALLARVNSMGGGERGPFPAGSGPTDSMLLGLHVLPVDTSSLAGGAVLTYVKKSGNFQFL